MFRNLPTIESADEILERSFIRARKKKVSDKNAFYQKKKTIIARTESFATTIINVLESYVKKFPSLNQLPMFYQELIKIKIDDNKLKKALGAIQWAKQTCQSIYQSQSKAFRYAKDISYLDRKQREIYGRIASVVKQIDPQLSILAEAQSIMRIFPDIQDTPTVVIAGYPNVGKSSLLRCLSNAKPKIAQYPFTTKEIHVGHMSFSEGFQTMTFQLIDTPGLLERPPEKRNEIEKLAVAALKYLADLIVFLIDPSETCGYTREQQEQLLTSLQTLYQHVPFLIVETKVDIVDTSSDHLKISCVSEKGIKKLRDTIIQYYPTE
jgi:nucleolar GTP-binding protein